MLSNLFQSTTIPVLEEVVNFAQARQTVLAGNIANFDVPGYQARDLSVEDFQNRLRKALEERDQPTSVQSPGQIEGPEAGRRPLVAEVAKGSDVILRHDGGKVGMEHEVSEMVKNQLQHNLAMSILASQYRLLQTAISGKV
jgi:flagellar basal-body rod protein FlgB